MGADGDVPRERPFGGRSHLRPVADGSAEDVQVKGPAGREPPREGDRRDGNPPWSGCGGVAAPTAALAAGSGERQGRGLCFWAMGGRGWKRGKVFVRGTGRNPGRSLAPVGSG